MTPDAKTNRHPEDYLMAFEDSCDRVPVLLIHGFPLSSSLWDFQIDGLADIARVIAPDLRGFGLSESTLPPASVETYASDCARLLDHLGMDGPVVVAGLSMGGYIAFEFCRRYPERVGGLILASTKAGADSAEAKAGRDKTAATVTAEGVKAVADGMLPKLLAPASYDADPELVTFVRDMMLTSSVDGVVGALAAMRDRPDSTPDLPKIDLPTLVIHGHDDQLIPVKEAELMAGAIPDSEMVVMPGAGHLPNLEWPDVFNEVVREFLEGFY